jgi:RimJ/RimL family protein N-acetyltransferase
MRRVRHIVSLVITTERLELHPFTVELATAIAGADPGGRDWIDGFPREDDQDAARMFLKLPADTYPSYAIVVRLSGQTVGSIGFFGPPDDEGTVMIGYGLAEAARGFGYATEAVRGLIGYAFSRPEVTRILADTDADNVASHRVLEKAGFARVAPGQWVHERG